MLKTVAIDVNASAGDGEQAIEKEPGMLRQSQHQWSFSGNSDSLPLVLSRLEGLRMYFPTACLEQRAATATAGAGGAGVTMIAGDDCPRHHLLNRDGRNIEAGAGRIGQRKIEHLIEIAVVDRAGPADTD